MMIFGICIERRVGSIQTEGDDGPLAAYRTGARAGKGRSVGRLSMRKISRQADTGSGSGK